MSGAHFHLISLLVVSMAWFPSIRDQVRASLKHPAQPIALDTKVLLAKSNEIPFLPSGNVTANEKMDSLHCSTMYYQVVRKSH